MKTDKEPWIKVGANLYRRQGIYIAVVKKAGKKIKYSLRTKDPVVAKERLRNYRGGIAKLAKGQMTFRQLAEAWLKDQKTLAESAYKRRSVSVRSILQTCGFADKDVRTINPEDIKGWVKVRAPQVKPRTFNIDLEALNAIFNDGLKVRRVILENPAAEIKTRSIPKRNPDIPTREQFAALVAELRKEYRNNVSGGAADFVEFLGYSGARLGGAINLCWGDLKIGGESFSLTEKFGNQRDVPLFPALRDLVERLQAGQPNVMPTDRIFRAESAQRGCLQAIHSACKRAGLPRFGHHSMRHFFCSNALEVGIDAKTIAEWLGHGDGGILVLRTYGHLRAAHSKEMARKITWSATTCKASVDS